MQCGISTSCFYPLNTAASLEILTSNKVKQAEIFLNTFSETEPSFLEHLKKICSESDINILSLHPFTSGMETFFFASEYSGRLQDGLRIYRRYFEMCRELGAKRLVFHGCAKNSDFSFRDYCKNYLLLRKTAREYGVDFCHENVVRCKCGYPEYIRKLREYTEDDVSFVLDVKQQRRAEVSLDEMLNAMGNRIVHVHLSDYTADRDCITPGKGLLSLNDLFARLKENGFSGDIIIELYRSGFDNIAELCHAAEYVDGIYNVK